MKILRELLHGNSNLIPNRAAWLDLALLLRHLYFTAAQAFFYSKPRLLNCARPCASAAAVVPPVPKPGRIIIIFLSWVLARGGGADHQNHGGIPRWGLGKGSEPSIILFFTVGPCAVYYGTVKTVPYRFPAAYCNCTRCSC